MAITTDKKQKSTRGSEVVASTVHTSAAARRAGDVVQKCIVIYGVFGAVVLTTLAAAALGHGSVITHNPKPSRT